MRRAALVTSIVLFFALTIILCLGALQAHAQTERSRWTAYTLVGTVPLTVTGGTPTPFPPILTQQISLGYLALPHLQLRSSLLGSQRLDQPVFGFGASLWANVPVGPMGFGLGPLILTRSIQGKTRTDAGILLPIGATIPLGDGFGLAIGMQYILLITASPIMHTLAIGLGVSYRLP